MSWLLALLFALIGCGQVEGEHGSDASPVASQEDAAHLQDAGLDTQEEAARDALPDAPQADAAQDAQVEDVALDVIDAGHDSGSCNEATGLDCYPDAAKVDAGSCVNACGMPCGVGPCGTQGCINVITGAQCFVDAGQ